MSETPKKSAIRRFFASRLFFLFAFVLFVAISVGYARAYYQDYKIKQEIVDLENQVRALENKKIESMEILQYVMSQGFVEEKARLELNMKKPGEKVAILKTGPIEQYESVNSKEESESDLPNPLKWLYYFLHKRN